MSRQGIVVSEELVHDAVLYLSTQSDAAAVAKGNQVRAEYHRRKIRATLILAAPHSSQGLREAYADSHEDYEEVCKKLATAEEEVERHRNNRSRAETICEMWRTQSATLRGLSRVA
jgi:predicted nuclease with TOPRIM domain